MTDNHLDNQSRYGLQTKFSRSLFNMGAWTHRRISCLPAHSSDRKGLGQKSSVFLQSSNHCSKLRDFSIKIELSTVLQRESQKKEDHHEER